MSRKFAITLNGKTHIVEVDEITNGATVEEVQESIETIVPETEEETVIKPEVSESEAIDQSEEDVETETTEEIVEDEINNDESGITEETPIESDDEVIVEEEE